MRQKLIPEKRRWLIVAVIFLAIVFNYVDRQIVSILKPTLKDVFSLGDDGYAFIINIFTICYAGMYPVTGWLVDRFGAGKVMLYGIIACRSLALVVVSPARYGSLPFSGECLGWRNRRTSLHS